MITNQQNIMAVRDFHGGSSGLLCGGWESEKVAGDANSRAEKYSS